MYSEEQDSQGLLTLHYGKHHATIIEEIKTCFTSENFADITFICDDKTALSAHKLIMASASPLVRRILGESVHAHGPSVVLIPGIKSCHFRHLLDFLYNGQACIKVRKLSFKSLGALIAFYLQSSELESIQELFELLQIKSDMWQPSDSDRWLHSDSDSIKNVQVKEEGELGNDDEKEEGEIKDDDDDDDDDDDLLDDENDDKTGTSSTSPNPVNLSLNTKGMDDASRKSDEGSDSQVTLNIIYFQSRAYKEFFIEIGTEKYGHVKNRTVDGENSP